MVRKIIYSSIILLMLTSCSALLDKPVTRSPAIPSVQDARAEKLQRCIERFLRYGVKFDKASKECDERIYKDIEI